MTVAQAVWNQIQSNDHRLMRRVHRWRAPRWFRILMIMMTRLGDGWLWYSLGLILLVYGGATPFLGHRRRHFGGRVVGICYSAP